MPSNSDSTTVSPGLCVQAKPSYLRESGRPWAVHQRPVSASTTNTCRSVTIGRRRPRSSCANPSPKAVCEKQVT